MKEEIKMEEPVMVMMEIKEEEKFEEAPVFEEMIVMEEEPKRGRTCYGNDDAAIY